MKNRIRSLSVLLLGILLFLFLWSIKPKCLFYEFFGFPCPTCYMTRAFECIFSFDVYGAFCYNILALPLFLFLCFLVLFLIFDIIFGRNLLFDFLIDFCEKYFFVILFFLIVGWVINIIKKLVFGF